MMQTRMDSAGINQLGQRHLVNAPQAVDSKDEI